MKKLAPHLLLALSLYGQNQNSGPATTRGTCSPANTGNGNTFTIQCGIGQEQGRKMLEILNHILSNQLDPDAVMAKLNEILHAVNPNAPRVTYTLNGSTRTITPQGSSLVLSDNPVFKEIIDFDAAKDWSALATACERAMVQTPEWYTPYYFASKAYAALGQKDKAVQLLERADQGMAGNRDYGSLPAEVKRILALLRQK